jgi:hypothetical protein
MGNVIKYTTTPVNNSIKKGNFALGINDVDYGPTNITGFYATTTPSTSGYTIYNENGGTLSYESVSGTTPLINYLSNKRGVTMTTAGEALSWAAGQSNIFVTNRDYENIVTSGMVLNLDAGFVSSYPTSATTWYDLSYSGNNGTLINGPTFSSLSGGTIVFDGVDDYVSESNFSGIITNSFAISTWINFANVNSPTNQKIFHAQSGVPEVNLDNYFGGSGNAKLHFYTAANIGSTNNIMTSNEDIINNVWYHLTAIYDDNLYFKYLYVNGILKNFGTTTVKINWPNSVTRIGLRLTNLEPFNGRMSSIQLYNRTLSPFEIYQNYNTMKGRFGIPDIVTSGLTLNLDAGNPYSYNPLITGSTTWTDVSGNGNNGTLINGTFYSGGTMVFDGTDNYVRFNSGLYGRISFSLEYWFYQNAIESRAQEMFTTNYNNPGIEIYSNGTTLYFRSNFNNSSRPATVTISAGRWNHVVAICRVDSGITIYLNGVEGTSNTPTNPYITWNNDYFNLGVITGYSQFLPFNGKISNAKIYNRALSASEVQQNFNALRGRYGI